MDAIFEGEKHSAVPDVEAVRLGKVTVDTTVLEEEVSTIAKQAPVKME
jgi:hypothetical protein